MPEPEKVVMSDELPTAMWREECRAPVDPDRVSHATQAAIEAKNLFAWMAELTAGATPTSGQEAPINQFWLGMWNWVEEHRCLCIVECLAITGAEAFKMWAKTGPDGVEDWRELMVQLLETDFGPTMELEVEE